MTWAGWVVLLCELGAMLVLFLAWQDERADLTAALDKMRAERDQARSDLDFTTEVLSDVAADRAHMQDRVLSLEARLRVQDIRRWSVERYRLN